LERLSTTAFTSTLGVPPAAGSPSKILPMRSATWVWVRVRLRLRVRVRVRVRVSVSVSVRVRIRAY